MAFWKSLDKLYKLLVFAAVVGTVVILPIWQYATLHSDVRYIKGEIAEMKDDIRQLLTNKIANSSHDEL